MIGTITKLLFYDVGEAIALTEAAVALGMAVPERTGRKPQAPAYVEYTHPPLSFDAIVDRRRLISAIGSLLHASRAATPPSRQPTA